MSSQKLYFIIIILILVALLTFGFFKVASSLAAVRINRHPVIVELQGPQKSVAGAINVYSLKAFEPETDSYEFSAVWGDGATSSIILNPTSSSISTSSLKKMFTSGGDRIITLKVQDKGGAWASKKIVLKVDKPVKPEDAFSGSPYLATGDIPNRHPVIVSVLGPDVPVLNATSTYRVFSYEPDGDAFSLRAEWDNVASSTRKVATSSGLITETKFERYFTLPPAVTTTELHRLNFAAFDEDGIASTFLDVVLKPLLVTTSSIPATPVSMVIPASLFEIAREKIDYFMGVMLRIGDELKQF